MGFSTAIKQRVMIDTARHCCVCHRYKGIKMEVHHLKQKADGGDDTYENAIPLCFDCHADAGHFNNRHPRGTKFSVQELLKARDRWYEYVRNNHIVEKLIYSDKIQTSYYVLNSFDELCSVLKHDLTTVNRYRSRSYLSTNPISEQWNRLLQSHYQDYEGTIDQTLIIEGRNFTSVEEYVSVYKNVSLIDRSSRDHPSYEAKRNVEWSDLMESLESKRYVQQLINSGIKASDFCTSVLNKNEIGCGDGEPGYDYTELFEIAPISFIFIGITNASKNQIKLNWLTTTDENVRVLLPKFNLLPMEMVLIPISTAININRIDEYGECLEHIDGDRGLDYTRLVNTKNFDKSEVKFFENIIYPKSVIFNDNEGEYEIEVHEFDFTNLYSINSYWQCGSCPHLFLINNDGCQQYCKKILVAFSNRIGSDIFSVPDKVSKIIIRELEDEITYLNKIHINGVMVYENIVLKKGESILIDVTPLDKVVIEGYYKPNNIGVERLNDFWYRNDMIKKSNANFNERLSQSSEHYNNI